MPIKPENKKRYPKNWKEIRSSILKRSGNCCEGSPKFPDCKAKNHQPHPETGSKVVLTIAHLDHMPENCEPDNLRAWCQRCHNTYDAKHRKNTREKTIKKKNKKCIIDTIFRLFPKLPIGETQDFLCTCTAFPFVEQERVCEQLEELAVQSGSDHEKAMEIADQQLQAAMATRPDELKFHGRNQNANDQD